MIKTPRTAPSRKAFGFALPTILVASVVMMIVLVGAVTTIGSIRTSLQKQYYQRLAALAAESGLSRASECLRANDYIPQWTTLSPLRPNTDCSGGAACKTGTNCFVMSEGNTRTTFKIDAASNSITSQKITATGEVQVLRPSGDVWLTYHETRVARVSADVGFGSVSFGYTIAGGAYFITIAADGTLRGTGGNMHGQLGNGTLDSSARPTTYALPSGYYPTGVYSGFLSQGENTFISTREGKLFASGANPWGQLGDGTIVNRPSPVEVLLPGSVRALSVTPNGKSTFILGSDNNVYAMGRCVDGQLGTGYTIAGCVNQTTPKRVLLPAYSSTNLNTQPTSQISADAHSAYIVMKGGRVYGWGKNLYGQLATGDTFNTATPIKIGTWGDPGQPAAVSIAFDGDDLVVVDSAGLVKTVGRNRYGMLGNGTTVQSNTFVNFPLPVGAGNAIKASSDHSSLSIMTDNGQVWSAGLNDDGQLGNGSTSLNQTTPVRFILPAGVQARDVYNTSTGAYGQYSNVYVVGSNGRVYGAGGNSFGQLGDGTTTNRSTPVAMNVIDGVSIRAKSVQAGFGTAVVLTTNDKIYTVGHNDKGQLGDGTTVNSSTPAANRYTNIVPPTFF